MDYYNQNWLVHTTVRALDWAVNIFKRVDPMEPLAEWWFIILLQSSSQRSAWLLCTFTTCVPRQQKTWVQRGVFIVWQANKPAYLFKGNLYLVLFASTHYAYRVTCRATPCHSLLASTSDLFILRVGYWTTQRWWPRLKTKKKQKEDNTS